MTHYVWKLKDPKTKKLRLLNPQIQWHGDWTWLREEFRTVKGALKFKNIAWADRDWVLCEVTTQPLTVYGPSLH